MSNALGIARKEMERAAADIQRCIPHLDASNLDPEYWEYDENYPPWIVSIPEDIYRLNAMANACRALRKAEAEALAELKK